MRIRLKNGFDIPLNGAPDTTEISAAKTRCVALIGSDYAKLRPSLNVVQGDRVRAGQTLFTERKHPEIHYVAPASGVVSQINLGRGRRLESIIIKTNDDSPIQHRRFSDVSLPTLPDQTVREHMLATGQWAAFRARPFELIPPPDLVPRSIFVTAIDTNPLAPDPCITIRDNIEDFQRGVTVVSRLTMGPTYVCTAVGWDLPLPQLPNVSLVEFAGPHPAGLPGTHIHALESAVGDSPELWHIGYQDIIAIGRLFNSGRVSAHRVVAICGPGAPTPRLARVCVGADFSDLLQQETKKSCRVVSGSVLAGHESPGFLGRYHNQITVLPNFEEQRHWLQRLGQLILRGNLGLEYPTRGAAQDFQTGMWPLEDFDRVWPYEAPPAALLRALLVGDVDSALDLGCRGLAEEDLALCTYVCAAKRDYGAALRRMLHEIKRRA